LKRVKSQWPLNRKRMLADFFVDNSGYWKDTKLQVRRLYDQFKSPKNVYVD